MNKSSEASTYVALALVSIGIGFFAGSRMSNNDNPSPQHATDAQGEEAGGSSCSGTNGASSLQLENSDDCKLALVVRTDLGMTAGKIAAQCSHATLACYKTAQVNNPVLLRHWERAGQTKVALRCSGEEELLELQAQAKSLNLCARSIQDAGRTQIAAGSRTVLGVLGPSRLVNQVTGKLRLL